VLVTIIDKSPVYLKKNTASISSERKMNKPELLGCVYVYDDEYTRNCYIKEEFNVPLTSMPIRIYCT
jgi:hypothetical protein